MRRLNIVLIDAHDTGDWLGCYGRPYVASPAIDSIAERGVRFENNISACPICGPSRLAFSTGVLPHTLDVYGNALYEPRGDCTPLARALGNVGYHTMLLGGWKTNGRAAWAGYSQTLPEPFAPAAGATDPSATALREALRAASDRPVFSHVSFQRCHRALGQTWDPETARRVEVPRSLPDLPAVRQDLATLCRTVAELDAQVGLVLSAIEESGRYDDTVVIFLTDGGLRSALLIRHPEGRRAATVSEAISNMDIYPTILEIAGITPPAGPEAGREDDPSRYAGTEGARIHGRTALPLVVGDSYTPRAATMSSFTYGQRSGVQYYTPMRCLRTNRYKLVHNYTNEPPYLDTGWLSRMVHDRGTVESWPRFGQPAAPLELYDVVEDPWETTNLVDRREHAGRVRAMDDALTGILAATGDEVLTGAVTSKKDSPVVQQWIRPESSDRYVLHYDFHTETRERPFGWNQGAES